MPMRMWRNAEPVGRPVDPASISADEFGGCVPKVECCASRPRCGRCPIRMLRDGRLPEGYAVRRRRLVRLD